MKNKKRVYETIFAILLFIGIMVCTISDIVISNVYTWSLIPTSSVVFAWVALLPIRRFGHKRIWASLIILNICIISYLYALNNVVKDTELIFSVGTTMATISIIYLIAILGIFKIMKKKKFAAIGFSLFLGIPICVIINVYLSKKFKQEVIDLWDLLAIFVLLVLAILFLVHEFQLSRERKNRNIKRKSNMK